MSSNLDIKKYIELKNAVKKHYRDMKLGEQDLYTDQSRLFKPLIDSSNQLLSNQQNLSNTLLPLTNRLEKRIEQVEDLKSLPYYGLPEIDNAPMSHSTPQSHVMRIDLDQVLNETDRENLQDLSFELPSIVQHQGNYEEILDKIKTENKRIGQFIGKVSKKSQAEKDIYESQK